VIVNFLIYTYSYYKHAILMVDVPVWVVTFLQFFSLVRDTGHQSTYNCECLRVM